MNIGTLAAISVLLVSFVTGPARADDFTGDYNESLDGSNNKNVTYNCNSLAVIATGHSSISGTVNCNSLSIHSSGAATVSFEGSDKNVTINSDGYGKVDLNGLEADSINIAHADGSSKLSIAGKVKNIIAQGIDGNAIANFEEIDVDSLHISSVDGNGKGYFKIVNSGQVRLVTGKGLLYIRNSDDADQKPSLNIHQVNGEGEVHWCGVSVHTDMILGNGKVIEDCDW